MRGMIPPGAIALDAAEHESALATLKRAQEIAARHESLELSVNSTELDLGALLSEISEKRLTQIIHGVTLGDWTFQNFKQRDGRPMKGTSAKRLITHWRFISKYPEIEKVVRKGSLQDGFFTCRTSAYYAIKIAELSQWEKQERESYINTAPVSTEMHVLAQQHAMKKVQERILDLLRTKSSTELVDDWKCLKAETEPGQSIVEFWRLNSPVVEKHVWDKAMDELRFLVKISGEDRPDVTVMRPTAMFERFAGFVEDVRYAAAQLQIGNNQPLQSLIQVLGESDASLPSDP